jgi:parallel beta-helix repeat protein
MPMSLLLIPPWLLIAAVLLGGIVQGEAYGRTWHVAKQALPQIAESAQFRTISEAAARVAPGDTVLIHGGVYREHVRVEARGTAGRPICFMAAPGERVVVTGADEIMDWEQADPERHIYRTPWPHEFIGWNETHAHPGDSYHVLIGRSEQVTVDGYLLHQVLIRDQLSRGSFYVDLEAKQLYVWGYSDQVLGRGARVEASTRDVIWEVKGDYVQVRGLRFRFAANHAQQGAAQFSGHHAVVEDCVFERTNGVGADFGGRDAVVRRCTFQDNGQLGFGAERAHNLLLTECTVRNNNTKGFDRDWEAGGNKIVLSKGVVIENSTFIDNRGHGIWFDIGNESCEVRNCLLADNEDCGIFYEISYGLRAHDNVIIGNGFAESRGAWGASSGISLSSSPGCTIERNLIVGNKEGFDFREQGRTTPHIADERRQTGRRQEHPIWNHDEVIRDNVLAYNRDAQAWGWFDVSDQRHWPAPMQDPATIRPEEGQPTGLTLEKLNVAFQNNVYYAASGQGFFNWGVPWETSRRYPDIDGVRGELAFDQGSSALDPGFCDVTFRDFRVPADSRLLSRGCYPKGDVPGVKLGAIVR